MNKASRKDSIEVDLSAVRAAPDSTTEIPFEPAVPDREAAASRRTLLELTAFRTHGGDRESVPADVWPAQMHSFRDLARHRLPFPLVLSANGEPQPLGVRIDALGDKLVAAHGLQGDDAERLRQDLRRVEGRLRAVPATAEDTLAARWRKAADELVKQAGQDGRDRLKANLEWAAAEIGDEQLLDLDAAAPARLVRFLLQSWWRTRHEQWRSELDDLVEALEAWLRAEEDRSDRGRDPDRLAHSVGAGDADELDFEALSEILGRSRLDQPLPEDRHERIGALAASLNKARAIYPAGEDDETSVPSVVHGDCSAAKESGESDLSNLVALVRDTAMARIELENRYQPKQLDGYFAGFDASHLDPHERGLGRPTLLVLDREQAEAQLAELLTLLSGDLPVKVVVELTLADLDPSRWAARLGNMALGLSGPFVFQGSLARPDQLAENFRQALEHLGPALLVIHRPDDDAAIPAFLQAAAAVESRLMPAFRFDPTKGSDLADQAVLLDNPASEKAWASEPFAFTDADGQAGEVELAFTAADLMAVIPGYREHFWCVPATHWHPAMQPLGDFLAADEAERDGRVPYVSLAMPTGELLRAVPDAHIVDAVRRVARAWRTLQELCGIENSHVAHALKRERDRLDAERDEAIEAARQAYEQQLERDVGELSRRIVTNIADRLLADEASPLPAAAPPPTAKTEPAARKAPEEAPADPPEPEPETAEPEVQFTLDEPYVDTALCTACDDCTTLNPEMFAYDENKQAYIKDPLAGTFQELVIAAEKCPVGIIHPGKPANPDEPDLAKWVERAKPYQ
ncbi:MAG: ferredoxin [Xanthomonadales bacterium]|nr:ferredoxin [Xanthomonadales bacterium]